ncbi:hypothetical protein ACJJTC_014592 [Scirpophaga incertulas]
MASEGIVCDIKPINTDTVHKICSGQVVLSLAVAVKELVENALDAGATNIDIRLKNYGTELIEVADNGTGVTEDNFAALTFKYYTSKLKEYSDLLSVSSFGFRGEALSSLCALSDLTITTRHQSSQYATKIEYDHEGSITKRSPCSRQVGTTVSLTNLFSSLPVRQKELHKNAKREFNKMTQLLYAYCLISLGVKITCTNQTSTNNKNIVVTTQGSMSYKDNIACVFGLKQLQSILEIKPVNVCSIKDNIFKGLSGTVEEGEEQTIEDIEIDLSENSNDADVLDEKIFNSQKSQGYKNVVEPVEFTGYISSCAHGSGRSSSDRQFYYVNSRPCEPPKIIKVVNEIYKQYNPNQYPFVFINVNIDKSSIDLNVTPDKRKIFLTKEKVILDVLKKSLDKLFEKIPKTIKIIPSLMSNKSINTLKADIDQPRIFNSLQNFKRNTKTTTVNEQQLQKPDMKRKNITMLDYVSNKIMKKSEDSNSHIVDEPILLENINNDNVNNNDKLDERYNEIHDKITNTKQVSDSSTQNNQEIMYLENSEIFPNTQIRKIDQIVKVQPHACKPKGQIADLKIIEKKSNIITDKEDLGKYHKRIVNLKTSIEHVKRLFDIDKKKKCKRVPYEVKFRSSINPINNKVCEEELTREISKTSFKDMTVIGQFNLGFIITCLGDDLFIVDQHATDEIYNFEMLQKVTELTTQKLVIPQSLELTGVNEQILMDNLDIFKRNGFTFRIKADAPPTKRVSLLTIPMSKNWIFGKEDIEELLFMLKESPRETCRPSRIRAMFASRACRKSVMIGTALSKLDMKNLIDHMSEIENPWNCPHGRPTIRHLVNLAMIHTKF